MATTQPKPPVTTVNPPKPTVNPPKPTTQPPITLPPKPPTSVVVPPKPTATVAPTNPIITVAPTTTKPPTTYSGGPILTVGPTTSSSSVGLGGSNRGGGSTSNNDGGGMSAAAIGGLVAGLAVVLVGSVVGGFMLLKQRRKRMMFVGLGAAGSSSRYGGDGYPDPPDLPRPPRAGFHREERPGSGSWSARSGYSGGGSSIGRKPFVANHSGIFDEKGYHAEAAGLGGARVSVMGGVGGGVGGYNSNLSGESFTQLYDGRFVANGRRGEGSQGGYVAGDVDHYPYDAQEYDARMHSKEMSSSAAFLPSPPSSPEGAYPPEGISPTESTSSGTTGLDGAINGGPQPSPPLGTGPGPNPRASGYYDFNHHPLRTPSRTNMHGGPPLSPNGNFVNRSTSRMSSASVPYAPDGLPLFPPRPASQYQHANYHPHPGQQHYPAPRSPPPHMAGGGGGPGPNGYYSPRMGPQYQQQQPLHPYHQHPQQQARFSQLPPQPQVHSGPISPISPMTSSSITAYDENEHGIHSTQKFVSNESFEKHQMYEEVYVHPLPQSEVTGSAPQALVEDNKSNNVNAPAAATPVAVDGSEPTDLASLAPIVPKGPVSAPPLPLSTKPSIGQLSTP